MAEFQKCLTGKWEYANFFNLGLNNFNILHTYVIQCDHYCNIRYRLKVSTSWHSIKCQKQIFNVHYFFRQKAVYPRPTTGVIDSKRGHVKRSGFKRHRVRQYSQIYSFSSPPDCRLDIVNISHQINIK